MSKFSPTEIAQILAEQQGLDADFFMGKIREGYAKGWLRFYLPDGSPYDYKEYPDHEYYLGLEREYSTPEDINAWLEAWGAEYQFRGGNKQPKEKKTAHQARLIIEALESLGYDPQQLPKPDGKAGLKKQIKIKLGSKYPFEASTAFNTAWKLTTKTEG